MKRIKREDEKGAMGIGTLIIFIAMVLVAAVAASVLISTAYDLQQQAQKTGDEAIREVSTSFVVKETRGRDSDGDGNIESIELKVGLAAGAPAQHFNQTVIQADNGSAQDDLQAATGWTNGETTSGGSGEYAIESLMEQDGNEYDILETGDTVLITIPTDGTNDIGTLAPQTEMTVRIIPKHGTPTLETFTTPPVIKDTIIHLA